MNEETMKYNELLIKETEKGLKSHFFDVKVCQNKQEALAFLQSVIGVNDVIGYGGSKTLEEIGFFDSFTTSKYPNILDRRKEGLTPEEKQDLQRRALTADVFLASPNGMSLDGTLVFIDKYGNRNAAVTFGPKHVYLVAGVNKITRFVNDALARASDVAAVKNNLRFGTTNPCTVTGECMECATENRLCGITTVLSRCFPPQSKTVILINEELGF